MSKRSTRWVGYDIDVEHPLVVNYLKAFDAFLEAPRQVRNNMLVADLVHATGRDLIEHGPVNKLVEPKYKTRIQKCRHGHQVIQAATGWMHVVGDALTDWCGLDPTTHQVVEA